MRNIMKYAMSALWIGSSIAFAGGTLGGGTPPSLQALEVMMMIEPDREAGLYTAETGNVGLLIRKDLLLEIMVTVGSRGTDTQSTFIENGSQSSGIPPASGSPSLKMSDNDIRILRDRTKSIEAIGSQGQNLSFDVLPGDDLNTMVLKNRRQIMREAAQAQ